MSPARGPNRADLSDPQAARAHHLQHVLGACYGALALGMVVATVLGIWLKAPGGPVLIPDPDALVRGGCAVALSEEEQTDYIGIACDDPLADVLVLDLLSPVEPGERINCPYGTDKVVSIYSPPLREVSASPSDDDGEPAEEPEVIELVCVRSLHPPHAGDAGAGGGVLAAGDCATISEDEIVVETKCDGSGEAKPEVKILAFVGDPLDCPDGTEEGEEVTGEVYAYNPELKFGDDGYEAICTQPYEAPKPD